MQCPGMASWEMVQRQRYGRPIVIVVCDDSKRYLTDRFRKRDTLVSAWFRDYFRGIEALRFTPLAGDAAAEDVEG